MVLSPVQMEIYVSDEISNYKSVCSKLVEMHLVVITFHGPAKMEIFVSDMISNAKIVYTFYDLLSAQLKIQLGL